MKKAFLTILIVALTFNAFAFTYESQINPAEFANWYPVGVAYMEEGITIILANPKKEAEIKYHTGEIAKLKAQLLDPNQENKDILRKMQTNHLTKIKQYLRS